MKSMTTRWRVAACCAMLAIGAYVTRDWLVRDYEPFTWVGSVWLVVGAALVVLIPSRLVRIVLVNGLAVVAAVVAFEVSTQVEDAGPTDVQPSHTEGFIVPVVGDILGYRPTAAFTDHARYVRDGKVVYDVRYTVGANGLRIAPPESSDVQGTLLVFGCSFTWGEGVEDNEALPYQIGLMTNGRYRVYNFGFSGYGPSQMLSALEHGMVDTLVRPVGKVTIIYQAIPDHVNRVSGLRAGDSHYPRYALNDQGKAEFTGHFNDPGIRHSLRRVHAFRLLDDALLRRKDSVPLFTAVVEQSRALLSEKFPGSDFHVLYWDVWDEEQVGDALRARAVKVHDISRILGTAAELDRGFMIPVDGHPNATAYGRLARYAAEQILGDAR